MWYSSSRELRAHPDPLAMPGRRSRWMAAPYPMASIRITECDARCGQCDAQCTVAFGTLLR